jgi:gliding motility-associated protein GldM
MAIPKEPRQKMINLMYLVLTAMLALNVSAEIINAFKVVDNSLRESNTVLTTSNDNIYRSFDELIKDPKTAEKAAIWKPKADKAKELASQTSGYIDKLKHELMVEADYHPETGDSTYKEENLDASTRLFDTKGEGANLYKNLENFKKNIMAIDPEMAKALSSKIPLSLEIPKSQSGNTKTGDPIKDWTSNYFRMTPTVAALTILSKFQNDVKNTESQVATYCVNAVGKVKIIYDKFEPLVGTNSTYFMPGEEMEVKAGLGAFNSDVKPSVTIDGRPIPVNASGVAETKFNVGGSGSRKMRIAVKYVDPNSGELKTLEKDLNYTVGQASGVAVMADKMNVLYIGVDNPLTITAGAGSERVSAGMTGGSISKAGGNKFVAKPTTPGEQTITVNVEGKAAGRVVYRVKYLPNPTGMVGNSEGGPIQSATFKAMGGIRALLKDSEFEAAFNVQGYTIGVNGPGFEDYTTATNQGPRWTGNAQRLVERLKPGCGVWIDDLRVQGPDGKVRKLPTLSFILR